MNATYEEALIRGWNRSGCWKKATEYAELVIGPIGWRGNRESRLRSQYGISALTWETMFRHQGGNCAICGRVGTQSTLNVDHCHATGRVRALLCTRCNVGLGTFEDDELFLDLASVYLTRHGGGRFSRSWSVWDPCPYMGLRGVRKTENGGETAP